MQSCWWFVTWSDSLFHTDWMMFTCGTVWQKWQMKETTAGRLENKKASFIDIKLNPQKNKRHKMKGWEGRGSRCEHADALTKSDGKHSDLNTLKLINKWNAGESEIKGEKKTKRFFICAYPKTCVLFRPWMWAPLLNTRLDPSPADFLLKTRTERRVLNMLYVSKECSVNQDNTGCSTCVNQKMLCLVHGLIC